MDQELKPCPFCGGEAAMWHANDRRGAWIACMGRCATLVTEEKVTDAKAIAAWNARAAPDLHGYVLTLLDALAAAEARERAAVEAAACGNREGLEAIIDQMAAAMADRLIARNREDDQ